MVIKRALASLVPRSVWWTLHNYRILSLEFGQFKTISRRECIDKYDSPIPWYTYPAIEYIKQLDLSDKSVFEYGSGNSTLFWAQRCQKVVSIEDSELWYQKVRKALPQNVDYSLVEDKDQYVKAVHNHPDRFDVIVIDGSHRYECAQAARQKLHEEGFMILDNSDWRERTSAYLRESDLIEVDMSGFGPINAYTWTTSFYFTRGVRLKPAFERQPMHGIGSLPQVESEQTT